MKSREVAELEVDKTITPDLGRSVLNEESASTQEKKDFRVYVVYAS